jgi:HTH-type transcriptional regulator/antitoxin HigA
MNLRPIRTEEEHDQVLRSIEELWNSAPGTPEADTMAVLVLISEAWESVHHPIDPPSPIDAILFRLDQMGTDSRALIGVIGSRTRVHEVLNGKRPLSLEMIRKLNEKFNIPADILIRRQPKPQLDAAC